MDWNAWPSPFALRQAKLLASADRLQSRSALWLGERAGGRERR